MKSLSLLETSFMTFRTLLRSSSLLDPSDPVPGIFLFFSILQKATTTSQIYGSKIFTCLILFLLLFILYKLFFFLYL